MENTIQETITNDQETITDEQEQQEQYLAQGSNKINNGKSTTLLHDLIKWNSNLKQLIDS